MLPSRFLFLRGLIAGKFRLQGLLGLFGLMLILSIGLGSVAPLWSQTPSPSPKEACAVQLALCADIKSLAQEDVVDDIPRRTAHAIDLFKEKHPDWKNDPNKAKLEVSRIYDREYSQREKTNKQDLPSIWKRLTANVFLAPFLGLVLLALAGWFKDGIGKGWTALTKKIDDWVYGRFAGTPFFENLALKRYREALVENYQELKIPFRVNHKPLDMSEIYIPLKVAGSSDSEQIDAYGSIAKYRRLVIKGIPGSGKTMLLQHVAFSYGKGNLIGLENRPVPVLLELHRLSDADLTEEKLIGAIVEAFKRNRFPKAERFVRHSLEQGKLMLLLDGLDEVNSKVRSNLALKISDLLRGLDKKQGCRLIVTCRTAVYDNEFAGENDQTLEVVEFTDQQMRQFLEAWKKEIPVGKSIDQLIQTLRDRPRIMSLARNPLLLTIITHLYTDPAFELPRSRTEFYQESTRILLDQWQLNLNKYRGADKQRVLQQLALYQQKTSTEQLQDRRSIDYTVVLEQIGMLLPSLNLDPKNDSIPLLTELVERSGLFLRIDGGQRYQFAHLTLQEYFAAVALADKSDELVLLFEQDPISWREVIKLWCGIAGNSTSLITKIYKRDELLAFECLADAQEVDQLLADSIIDHFQELLGSHDQQEELVRAFGAVAASDRPRGQKVFQFLQYSLYRPMQRYRYESIAQAISFTNRPQAAKILAKFYAAVVIYKDPLSFTIGDLTNEIAGQYLVGMGDLAVPELVLLANQGLDYAVNDLHSIGTVKAAEALVPMLWMEQHINVQSISALCLASLLKQPIIENGLNNYSADKLGKEIIVKHTKKTGKLPMDGRITCIDNDERRKKFTWVWEPFQFEPNLTMVTIFGRITQLINAEFDDKKKNYIFSRSNIHIDPRIAIPLFAIQDREKIQLDSKFKSMSPKQLKMVVNITNEDDFSDKNLYHFFRNLNSDAATMMILIKDLSPALKFSLIYGLATAERTPNIYDWLSILHPIQFEFKNTRQYKVLIIISFLFSTSAILGLFYIISTQKILSIPSLPVMTIIILISFFVPELTKAPAVLMTRIRWLIRTLYAILCGLAISSLSKIGFIVLMTNFNFPSTLLSEFVDLIEAIFIMLGFYFWIVVNSMKTRSLNPLHGGLVEIALQKSYKQTAKVLR
jgi:NACHT domain